MKRASILALCFVLAGCETEGSEDEAIGACCNGDACTLVTEANCGGMFVGGVCGPNPCETIGACCEIGGACSLTPDSGCNARFIGAGTECSMCPTSGACCDEENFCTEVERPDECDGRAIIGAPCDPDPCETPPPAQAVCCNGTECSIRTAAECSAGGGTAITGLSSCDQNPCDRAGACCLDDGRCIEVDSPDCGGIYVTSMGMGPTCMDNTCNGACCDADNQCSIRSLADCGDGDFIGPRTSCEPNPCADPVGACCEPEGCEVNFQSECTRLFFANQTCDPDPCPIDVEISAEVTEICAGVTPGDGVSSLAWSFAVASSVSLAGEALALSVDGPGDPFGAEGEVDGDGLVRIEDVEVDALGTYEYEVLSVGSATLTGDLNGSLVVDGSEQPCPPGGGGAGGSGGTGGSGGVDGDGSQSPYAGCVERPPGSVECGCDPFVDNCVGNLNCSIYFFVNLETSVVESVPALDGSDCCPASSCISDVIQTVGLGGACNINLTGTFRRDDCLPGLFCDPESNEICVPLCVSNSDCADDSCELFSLSNPDFGPLGRCSAL